MCAAPPDDSFAPPPRPTPFVLGLLAERYELLGELGHGGMAAVYHARERAAAPGAPAGREVAIKVVRSRDAADPDALRRFAREAETMAGLDHPNIVRTLAIEQFGGEAVAIVTAYVRGRTLRDALTAAGGPLPFDAAAAVLRDLASALAYAHARRLVHRDVKPDNAFLDEPSGRALLADFGIARSLDDDPAFTVHGASLGTPTYMAPEQIAGGAVDERTDVYALALVGWEMLAGRRPWQGETLYALLHKQQFEALPDLAAVRPDIPAYLLEAIRGGLAKDPGGRWRDGAEMLDRLTPRPQPLPAAWPAGGAAASAGAASVAPADETIRVPTPAERDAITGVIYHDAGSLPPPGPRARAPRRARSLRTALVAAVLGAAVLAGGVVARQRASDRRSRGSADAATTGVTDAELAELLRAANAAAQAAGVRSPAVVRSAPAGAPPPAGPSAPPVRPAPSAAQRTAPSAVRRTAARTAVPVSAPVRAPVAAAAAAADDPRCASPATADQQACLMGAVERQDAGLNTSYQRLIAALRRDAGDGAEPPAVRALRAEQRAWVDARDRQCRAAVAGGGGALWGAARAPCFAALSERRAREFDARRERLTGDAAPATAGGDT